MARINYQKSRCSLKVSGCLTRLSLKLFYLNLSQPSRVKFAFSFEVQKTLSSKRGRALSPQIRELVCSGIKGKVQGAFNQRDGE